MTKIISFFTVLMLFTTLAFAQQRTVTGKVTDESGAPVPFATITETGTKNGTTADAEGNFNLSIKTNGKLTISSTGFEEQSVTPRGNTASIRLTRTTGQLQEVVVTALGQTRSKDRIGYSASTFRSEDITRSAPVSPL